MKPFNYTTASRQILGDLHTPVSTYLKVRDMYPQSALMESSDYHSPHNSRSFIALNPMASIAIGHGTATACYPNGEQIQKRITPEYRTENAINDFLANFSCIPGDKKRVLRTLRLYIFQCRALFREH